jgi:uncharacterized alkaline shock family protein YloU
VTDGHASISADILARYAADATSEVSGVRALVGRHPVRINEGDVVEIHIELEWGTAIPAVGRGIQESVREYLARMARLDVADIHVVVDRVGPIR